MLLLTFILKNLFYFIQLNIRSEEIETHNKSYSKQPEIIKE